MNGEPLRPSSPFAVVVNDDPTQLSVLSVLVRHAGLEPRAFANAEAALADMSACAATADMDPGALPALVVTDLYMPGIDGWRFCRLLRSPEYAAFNQVPILVVSATFAGDEADRIAASLGAEAFLSSPVDARRFAEQVGAILKGRQVRTPLRVLIVEDSEALIGTLKKAFEANGCRADTALTAREAADAFEKTVYDVAVLDHHLPDGTGDVLLDAFRVERPDCVCIMITTAPGPDLALDWMKRGAAAYLRKPFEPEYLIELCTRSRRERALLRVQDLLELRTRELRESEALYRSILNASPDAITITDVEGRIRLVSPSALTMLGYKQVDDLVGRPMIEFVVPGDRDRAQSDVAHMVQGVFTGPGEYRAIRTDGRPFDVEVNGEFVRSAGGQSTGMVFIIRDITGRKRAEEKITSLLAEKELLLKEVHHRIKNNMNTMMSLLSLQTNSMVDPKSVAALNDARGRMQSMMVLYDKLYRSEGFRELSMKEYLAPLVYEIIGNFPNRGMVTIETRVEDFILDAKRLSPLGIIVNELLTNVMKHAFTGRDNGLISISALLKAKHATVVVQDNGIGLGESFDLKTSAGFGLRLVGMLTEQIGGSMRIEQRKGTTFILEFEV
jgi:PAS domain S-box-containing protein